MKKIILIIILLSSIVFGEEILTPKTNTSCSQERYESLKKFVAENPDSPAIMYLEDMEARCPNLKK